MKWLLAVFFVVLVSCVLPCPLDTRVVQDDRGCDICDCCRFANGEYGVYCSGRSTEIPPLPIDTTYLDLRRIPVYHLSRLSFPHLLPRLKTLLLGNDTHTAFALKSADSNAFSNLPELTNVTLSLNLDSVSTFLNSAKKLKNLRLLCARNMTQEDYKILFYGLRLTVLETHGCSFDIDEDTFSASTTSTPPTALLVRDFNRHPCKIELPKSNVSLFYSQPLSFKLMVAHKITLNCVGVTTSDCMFHVDKPVRDVRMEVNVEAEVITELQTMDQAQQYSLRIRRILDDKKDKYLDHILRSSKTVSKLSLRTDNFPQYGLLGSDFLQSVGQTSELFLHGYQLGEVEAFVHESFTCTDCFLDCHDCLLASHNLRKLNITDSESKVLISLGKTLRANPNLEQLILHANRLTVDMFDLPYHTKLANLELSATTPVSIHTGMNLSALVNLRKLVIRNIKCPTPVHSDHFVLAGLKKLEFLDLSDWDVTITGPVNNFFSGLESLKELRLRNNRFWTTLTRLEDLLMPSMEQLEILDISSNDIDMLECKRFFNGAFNLRRVDFSDNLMTILDGSVFRNSMHLSFLSFANNRLERLNEEYLQHLMTIEYLREVDISGNRLHCTCENRRLQSWMLSGRETNRLLVHYDEFCPHVITPTKFMNYSMPWIECDSHRACVILAATLSFVGVILAICVAVYYHRYDILFWWVVKRRYGIRRNHRHPIDFEKKFHAFLSYSSSEQDIAHKMFSRLEEGEDIKFKIAYDCRDFVPGDTIADNIIRCIDESEKVIFLISRQFLDREWCEFEMNYAQMRCIERKSVIIPIFVEKIEMQDLPNHLKILCRHVNYLQYPVESDRKGMLNFWHRLMICLVQDSLLGSGLAPEAQGVSTSLDSAQNFGEPAEVWTVEAEQYPAVSGAAGGVEMEFVANWSRRGSTVELV